MTKYNKEEVYNETLKYFNGDSLATDVWINKYCLKDSDGNLFEKTPTDMHHRIAGELARIEQKYPNPMGEQEIFELLDKFKYVIPAGSNLFGIGNDEYLSSLSNCFYLHHNNNDSYGGIMKMDEELVHLFKRRAGVGIDMSFLRPKNSVVNNAALSTTGAVSFMNRFSNTTKEVSLNGRRAALMITMDINHPEIEEFIEVKNNSTEVTGANISIKISDDFMIAVKNNTEFELKYQYSNGTWLRKKVNAKSIWDKFILSSTNFSEPGLLYWDKIKRESPSEGYEGFELQGVNPCSELTLSDSESCRLLSINLTSFIDNEFTNNASINTNLLNEVVIKGQRLMDDIVELELEKVSKIIEKVKRDPEDDNVKQREIELWNRVYDKAKNGRRTGLGITGLGDMVAMLNHTYGTKDATNLIEGVFKGIALKSYESSIFLAKERGSFKGWNIESDKKSEYIKRLIYGEFDTNLMDMYKKYGRRNIANLTIAPNGSLSLLSHTSSGVEPVFMINYKRRKRAIKEEHVDFIDDNGDTWVEFNVFHHKFVEWFNQTYNNVEPTIDILSLTDVEIVKYIEQSPYHNATATEIDYIEKIRMQGLINKWIDHSISMTVNLPSTITTDEVSDLYMKGWEYGLKGMTVYREGSRSGVLVKKEEETKKQIENAINENNAPKRPKSLDATIIRFNNNGEKWIGFIGLLNDQPYEIFTGKLDEFSIPNYVDLGHIKRIKDNGNGSRYDFLYKDKDGFEQEMRGLNRVFDREAWNMAKMISGQLRHGFPIKYVVKLIESLKFEDDADFVMTTWKKGVIRMLKKYIKNGEDTGESCPECGGKLVYQEGCLSCLICSYSKCG